VDHPDRQVLWASQDRSASEVIQDLMGHVDPTAIPAHRDLLDRQVNQANRVPLVVPVPTALPGHRDREASRVSLVQRVRADKRVTLDRWEPLDCRVQMDLRARQASQAQMDSPVSLERRDL